MSKKPTNQRNFAQVEVKDGGNLEDEEEAAGGCTLTRVIFPDLATTVVSINIII